MYYSTAYRNYYLVIFLTQVYFYTADNIRQLSDRFLSFRFLCLPFRENDFIYKEEYYHGNTTV